jgi:asparagine synthase (glutamine-hydrolysing)
MYSPGFAQSVSKTGTASRMRDLFSQVADQPALNQMLYVDTKTWLPDDLLVKADKISMANSLEVRVPFLDHKLVEFVARLPKDTKYRSEVPKSLLVEAMGDLLPDDVVGQPKRTFTLPWDVWLRGPLGVQISQNLANLTPPLLRYMNQRAVRGSWQNFVTGHTNWSRPWSIYVLNRWVQRHLSGSPTGQGSAAAAVRPAAIATSAANPRS